MELVRSLLAAGADVNPQALENCGPIEIAIQKGHRQVLDALLAAGTEIGDSSLRLAATGGHLNIIERLLATEVEYDVNRALFLAADNKHLHVVARLLDESTRLNTTKKKKRASCRLLPQLGALIV